MSDPRYPRGPFHYEPAGDPRERAGRIDRIAAAPARLRAAVGGLAADALDRPYREGGWTLRQIAHHLPDSHLNAYLRLRLALTQERPTITPYDQAAWAELSDARSAPVEVSVQLLAALHERWVHLLRSLDEADFARTFVHPEQGERSLDWLVALYAWHGEHHVGQIEQARAAIGRG